MQTTVGVLWIVTGVVTGGTGVWQLYRGSSFRWRRMLAVIIPLWVVATLAALLEGKTANLTGVLQGTIALATPITLGAFAGILSERSGLLNIAIEGKFLIGACVAAVVASIVRLQLGDDPSPFMLGVAAFIGIVAAAISGILVALLLAWLGIRWKVDQIIAGVVIGIGAIGITNFLFLRVLSKNTELNTPPTVEAVKCRSWATSRSSDHPVQPDAVRLLHAHRHGRVHVHAVQDALGPPPARIRREAVGSGHGRHRRDQDPLPGHDPRRDPWPGSPDLH